MIQPVKVEIENSTGAAGGWLVLLLLFWLASGFERVDCALGVQPACAMIQAKYQEKK